MRPQRSLAYNSSYKMTRMCNMYVAYDNGGFLTPTGNLHYTGVGFVYYANKVSCVFTSTDGLSIDAVVPAYAELAAVWDRVKIEKVELTVSSRAQDPVAPVTLTTNDSVPVIYFANDYTDVYNNTLDRTQQTGGVKAWHATSTSKDWKWNVVPKYQRGLYTPTVSQYEPASGYVSSVDELPHYGTRMAMDFGNEVGNGGIYIVFKLFYCLSDTK